MPREHIDRAADRYGVSRSLLRSMARVESTNDPKAVSKKGARGEFQIMPATARELGYEPKDMHDREKAADAAAKHVSRLRKRNPDWNDDDLVAAYNAGEARVRYRKKRGVPLPAETRGHVTKVKAEQAAEALRRAAR
jgi:soluble lytic murein transglycosylase-like protein